MRVSEERHLEADQRVLSSRGQVVGRVTLRRATRNGAEPHEDRKHEALPITGEDDALDAEELGHGAERLQVGAHADPEEGEVVEGPADADVVDQPRPEVARVPGYDALLERPRRLHRNRGDGQPRLDPRVLQNAPLHRQKGMRIADIHLPHPRDLIERPEMVDRRTSMHHDDEAALAAEEVDEELEEGVEDESLVDVAEGADPEGDAQRGEGGEGGGGEDGHQHEDADDVALEEGFAVVLRLHEGAPVRVAHQSARRPPARLRRWWREGRDIQDGQHTSHQRRHPRQHQHDPPKPTARPALLILLALRHHADAHPAEGRHAGGRRALVEG